MKVQLTSSEIRMAVNVGIERSLQSLEMGLREAHGRTNENRFDIHIEGAAAEQALAKALSRYWGGSIGTFKKPDIGANIQVRSTVLPEGCLIIRPDDNEDDYYVLVTGKIPVFHIIGYIQGREAKRTEFWRSPNGRPGAWFVPQEFLKKFNFSE